MSKITRYLRFQDGLSEWVGRATSWLTLGIIGVLLYEVAARYIFNAPTVWGHELATMFFGALSIMAGSYTLLHRQHVCSDVIYRLFPLRGQAFCDVIVYTLGILVLAVFFKMAVEFAYRSWLIGEYSNSSIWRPLVWPIKATIPVAVGLLILQSIAELVRAIVRLAGVPFDDPRSDTSE